MEKNFFFFFTFNKWKVQELSIRYFHSKLVDIDLRDQELSLKIFKIPGGFWKMCSANFHGSFKLIIFTVSVQFRKDQQWGEKRLSPPTQNRVKKVI